MTIATIARTVQRAGLAATALVLMTACKSETPEEGGEPTAPATEALGLPDAGALVPKAFEPVFDVTQGPFFVTRNACSPQNTQGIQAAINAASAAGGGVVYFPVGSYCTTDELKLYRNITLRGASMGVLDATSSSVVYTSDTFPAGSAVIRMADRTATNAGVVVERLSIWVKSTNPGVVGLDFSGVWYGAIRGVGILGNLLGSPSRQPASADSVGFLFTDMDGANPGGPNEACYGNIVERTSVVGMTTGYKQNSSQGHVDLNTVTNFWMSDVVNGFWLDSVGSASMTLRDGYMSTTVGLTGKKAFKETSGAPVGTTIDNVQVDYGFDAPSDLVMGRIGTAALRHGLTGMQEDSALFQGTVTLTSTKTRVINPNGPGLCGETEDTACSPWAWPPPNSISQWAKIPAGTALHAGENQFTFYTLWNVRVPTALPDTYFAFHVKRNGGLVQPTSWSGAVSVTNPHGDFTQTYTVSLYVGAVDPGYTLPSDLVFLMNVNQTTNE